MYAVVLLAALCASFDQVVVEATAAVNAKTLPGVAIIALEDGVIREAYLGRASDTAAIDAASVFEIGSITKTLTALVLAQMVHDGRLRLDSRLGELTEWELSPELANVTLLELATHTSGLAPLPLSLASLTSAMGNPADPYAAYDRKDFLSDLKSAKLGDKTYAYSNWGFAILGEVLAARAQSNYPALVTEQVFTPWHLSQSYLTLPPGLILAQGHDEQGRPAPPWSAGMFGPAGMVNMTGRDLLSYVTQTMTMKGPIADLLLTARGDSGDGKIALGWHMSKEGIHWHNGGTGGFRSFAGFDQTTGKAIAVLTNSSVSVDRLGALYFKPVTGRIFEERSTTRVDLILAAVLALIAIGMWHTRFASRWPDLARPWWHVRSLGNEALRFLVPPVFRPLAASRIEVGVLVIVGAVVAVQQSWSVGWNATGMCAKFVTLFVLVSAIRLAWQARRLPWTGRQLWRRLPSSIWWLGITLWP